MHLEMQMRSHCAAGMPHIGNDLPGFDLLAHRDTDAGAVRVQSSQPAAVVQLDVVSAEEYHIIYDHYFRQYSIQEIATRDKKSRQAINKCKKTALEKLRHYWGIKQ